MTQFWTGYTDWDKIFNEGGYTEEFRKKFKEMIFIGLTYNEFNECINAAVKQTVTTAKRKCEGWFWYSRNILRPLVAEKNHLLHSIKNTKGLTQEFRYQMEAELDRRQRHVKDQVKLAKSRYYANLAEGVHDMPFNPRLAWENIKLLAKGETVHHNRNTNMVMRNEDGSLVTHECRESV